MICFEKFCKDIKELQNEYEEGIRDERTKNRIIEISRFYGISESQILLIARCIYDQAQIAEIYYESRKTF